MNQPRKAKGADWPRRTYTPEWTKAERAIDKALQEVEKELPDPLLTDAIMLLWKAKGKVSDYVDAQLDKEDAEKAAAADAITEKDQLEDAAKKYAYEFNMYSNLTIKALKSHFIAGWQAAQGAKRAEPERDIDLIKDRLDDQLTGQIAKIYAEKAANRAEPEGEDLTEFVTTSLSVLSSMLKGAAKIVKSKGDMGASIAEDAIKSLDGYKLIKIKK